MRSPEKCTEPEMQVLGTGAAKHSGDGAGDGSERTVEQGAPGQADGMQKEEKEEQRGKEEESEESRRRICQAAVSRIIQVLRQTVGPPSASWILCLAHQKVRDGRAAKAAIKGRFKKLSILVHPDKNEHPDANEAFIALQNAKRDLLDPQYVDPAGCVYEEAERTVRTRWRAQARDEQSEGARDAFIEETHVQCGRLLQAKADPGDGGSRREEARDAARHEKSAGQDDRGKPGAQRERRSDVPRQESTRGARICEEILRRAEAAEAEAERAAMEEERARRRRRRHEEERSRERYRQELLRRTTEEPRAGAADCGRTRALLRRSLAREDGWGIGDTD